MNKLRSRLPLIISIGAVLAYGAFGLQRAWWVGADSPLALALSVATAIVVAISLGLVVREVMFGFDMSRIAKVAQPLPELPRNESGRYDQTAALHEYEAARAEVDSRPEDWQAWYRLAHAYDAARDRKQARSAMRQAVKLFNVQ